jgi:hypothetical protein
MGPPLWWRVVGALLDGAFSRAADRGGISASWDTQEDCELSRGCALTTLLEMYACCVTKQGQGGGVSQGLVSFHVIPVSY